MPNHKSAEKRDRQIKRRTVINRRNRSEMRTELKKLRSAISSGKKEDAVQILPTIVSIIDRAVKKGIIHDNTGSRYKSRLTIRVNNMKAKAA
ncbi:MAG: 30S ribosomal protein S20 [Acidobacteria bacterium]|nr:30S ribosomal protein S20 [Acidobacteriota bacterium]